jgi:hypothetical protein
MAAAASSGAEPVATVWEGEWPQLKCAVRSGRQATEAYTAAAREFVTETSVEAVSDAVETADRRVHDASLAFSRFCFKNPWVGQAAGITAFSSFIAAKSVRWGTLAALRNGALAMGVATACTFPDDLKRAAEDVFPTGL